MPFLPSPLTSDDLEQPYCL